MPAESTPASDPVADPALLPRRLILGSLTLIGRPEHVREARRFVAKAIGADHPQADTAMLLTSELVTNAVTHSRSRLPGGTVKLVVARKSPGLLIFVTDNGSDGKKPTVGSGQGGEHGNGLLLVASLADAWGFDRNSARTVVWFGLGTHDRTRLGFSRALLPGHLPSRHVLACGLRDHARPGRHGPVSGAEHPRRRLSAGRIWGCIMIM